MKENRTLVFLYVCFEYCDNYNLNCHLRRKPVLSLRGSKVQQFVFTQEITVLRDNIRYQEL